jgi:hypothetical protein
MASAARAIVDRGNNNTVISPVKKVFGVIRAIKYCGRGNNNTFMSPVKVFPAQIGCPDVTDSRLRGEAP